MIDLPGSKMPEIVSEPVLGVYTNGAKGWGANPGYRRGMGGLRQGWSVCTCFPQAPAIPNAERSAS